MTPRGVEPARKSAYPMEPAGSMGIIQSGLRDFSGICMKIELYDYGFRISNDKESLFFQEGPGVEYIVVYYERNSELISVIHVPLRKYGVKSFKQLQRVLLRNPEMAWRLFR